MCAANFEVVTGSSVPTEDDQATGARGYVFPVPPEVPAGPLALGVSDAVDQLLASAETSLDFEALDAVATSGDARLAWVVADLLRSCKSGKPGKGLPHHSRS